MCIYVLSYFEDIDDLLFIWLSSLINSILKRRDNNICFVVFFSFVTSVIVLVCFLSRYVLWKQIKVACLWKFMLHLFNALPHTNNNHLEYLFFFDCILTRMTVSIGEYWCTGVSEENDGYVVQEEACKRLRLMREQGVQWPWSDSTVSHNRCQTLERLMTF